MKISLNNKTVKYQLAHLEIKTKKDKSRNGSKMVTMIYYQFDVILKDKIMKDNQLSFSFHDPTIFSVLYPKDKVIIDKKINAQANSFVKEKCLFKVGFKL